MFATASVASRGGTPVPLANLLPVREWACALCESRGHVCVRAVSRLCVLLQRLLGVRQGPCVCAQCALAVSYASDRVCPCRHLAPCPATQHLSIHTLPCCAGGCWRFSAIRMTHRESRLHNLTSLDIVRATSAQCYYCCATLPGVFRCGQMLQPAPLPLPALFYVI